MPGHRRGQAPRNKGMRYPADPPTVEEIVLVLRHAGDRAHGLRLRGLIVVMWRAGLRISETLALTESDLDAGRGAILVRHGKGNKRREVGMDQWGWELLRPWLAYRVEIPVGPLFCLIDGTHPRAVTDNDQRSSAAAAHRREGRGTAPLRSAPVASRARGRDGARGRAAERHPTPTRTRQPRDHLCLPGGNRQRRDHRHRSRAASAGLRLPR
jgi:integrase